MSFEEQVKEILNNFDTVSISTLANILKVDICEDSSKISFEQRLCNLLISSHVHDFQIDGDFICYSKIGDRSAERLQNVLTKIASIG